MRLRRQFFWSHGEFPTPDSSVDERRFSAWLHHISSCRRLWWLGVYKGAQRAIDAEASQIWARLEFGTDHLQSHEVDGLMDLTLQPAVRTAFLRQMQ